MHNSERTEPLLSRVIHPFELLTPYCCIYGPTTGRFSYLPSLSGFHTHLRLRQVHRSPPPLSLCRGGERTASREKLRGSSTHLVQAADFLRRVDDLPAAGTLGVHPQRLAHFAPGSESNTFWQKTPPKVNRNLHTDGPWEDKFKKNTETVKLSGRRVSVWPRSASLRPAWKLCDAALRAGGGGGRHQRRQAGGG